MTPLPLRTAALLAAAAAAAAAATRLALGAAALPSYYRCDTYATWLPGAPFNQMKVSKLSAPPADACVFSGVPAKVEPCKTYAISLKMGESLAFKVAVSAGELKGSGSEADGKTCRYQNSKTKDTYKFSWVAPAAAAHGSRVLFRAVCGQFGGPVYAATAEASFVVGADAGALDRAREGGGGVAQWLRTAASAWTGVPQLAPESGPAPVC